jgi:thiaminase
VLHTSGFFVGREELLSLYEQLPDDLLAGFFVEMSKNIEKGILSEATYHEIALIKAAADKRALSEMNLREIYCEKIGPQYKQISSSRKLRENTSICAF